MKINGLSIFSDRFLKLLCCGASLSVFVASSSFPLAAVAQNDLTAPSVEHTLPSLSVAGKRQIVQVVVTDESVVERVEVFYRFAESPERSLLMRPVGDNVYEAQIELEDESGGRLSYYFIATDSSQNTAYEAFAEPFVVEIPPSRQFDFVPPTIDHLAISEPSEGLVHIFEATVTDNAAVDSVDLFVKLPGSDDFESMPMVALYDSKYSATVEFERPTSGEIAYYFSATDTAQNSILMGEAVPFKRLIESPKLNNEFTDNALGVAAGSAGEEDDDSNAQSRGNSTLWWILGGLVLAGLAAGGSSSDGGGGATIEFEVTPP